VRLGGPSGIAHEKLFDRSGRQRIRCAGERKKHFENCKPAKSRRTVTDAAELLDSQAAPPLSPEAPAEAINRA